MEKREKEQEQEEQKRWEFGVAGIRFHDFKKALKDMLEKMVDSQLALDLIPDPQNKYDEHAVKIMYKSFMLGYVPKRISQEVSDEILRKNQILRCLVTKLKPHSDPWDSLSVVVEVM